MFCLYSVALAFSRVPDDAVLSLPTYGPVKGTQYAGFANGTTDGANRLFYWFAECDCGNGPDVPFLLWLNGGPGASSLIGFLTEKLGPLSITLNSTLYDNPDRITKKYHLLVFDSPVGSGFSYSSASPPAYVHSEEQYRTQLVHALRQFFNMHTEYAANPFWVVGESYGGHYVPNVALEIAVNATEIPLQGVAIGNGMFNMKLQYPTLGEVAFAAGVIDEKVKAQMEARQDDCLAMIDKSPATAGAYCENVTVYWLYSAGGPAGKLFYYDVGIADGSYFDDITKSMSTFLNDPKTKAALHAEGGNWTEADETGPVGDALLADWTVNSDVVLAELLKRQLKVRLYNGVRDLSSCNHIGNLAVLLNLEWEGKADFAAAPSTPWPSGSSVDGHMRRAGLLEYATVIRTGHLVPTIVPEVYAALLEDFFR